MICQSMTIPKLEKNFAQIPLLSEAVSRYSLMCANVLATRELPWFTLDVAKEILEISKSQNMAELFSAQKKFGIPPVLTHGNLWPGNILWDKHKGDSEAKMLAIIDWQDCHAGSFTTDVAVLLGVSMNGETRRKEEPTILKFFYDKLIEYKKLAPDLDFQLTFEQLEESYKKSLRYAVLPMLLAVSANPHEDVQENGDAEGILTRRLRLLIEDVFGK